MNQRPSGYEYRQLNFSTQQKLQNYRICVVFGFGTSYLIPAFFMLFYPIKGMDKGINTFSSILCFLLDYTTSIKFFQH